ncbi:hypothetical protein HDF24_11080 [Mucilaginibacter sp. X4EP1]|uniref:hypothetical protein n=1 Tax=Mucilaginibacter sp. X4EP1 TaxID=2723092 RepID=UPI0021690E80|nr:hypothetical protein [Mucilaginibacter sp. X4EP1]MCS3815554.1 SNF family Na+-dependent transporter [Mucilaginibacter sp. X4EP1]
MKLKLTRALVLFFIAYVLVTILAATTTETYATVYNTSPPAPGVTVLKSASFVATVPYHVLIMLIVWPIFAWIYFKKPQSKDIAQRATETRNLAFLWLVAAITVDFVGFVLIKSPYSLTAHEFYIDYQPWITLIYIAIFLSPWINFRLWKLLSR